MTAPPLQTPLAAELAELARTLGNAHRLVLLEHIAQGERPVERLAELSGLSVANTSQHLQQLCCATAPRALSSPAMGAVPSR